MRTLADLIYAAAFFDAEGSVSISKGGKGWTRTVQIVNTYSPTIRWFKAKFNGHIYAHKPDKSHLGTKKVYVWKVYQGAEIGIFLDAVRPFVQQKKRRIDALLDQVRGRISYAEAKRRMR